MIELGKLLNLIKNKVEDVKYEKVMRMTSDLLGESDHKEDSELDTLYDRAIDLIFDMYPSESLLQAKLGISFSNAQQMMARFEAAGIVEPAVGTAPRKLSIQDLEQAKTAIKQFGHNSSVKESCPMAVIDAMDGHEFEYFVADLLKKLGYINVEVTRGSGDQGVDVLAEKDDIRYAIQCKNYTHPLGNTPIQEVAAGKDYYGCHIGVVITNSYFTTGGKDLAEHTCVLLWDRNKLQEMIAEASL